jgi:hypothetical protein
VHKEVSNGRQRPPADDAARAQLGLAACERNHDE